MSMLPLLNLCHMRVFLLVCVRACALNPLGSDDFCMQFAINETEGTLRTYVTPCDAYVKETS